MTQQRLGCHHNQRLAERQSDLTPQNVVVVGRGGAVCHNPIDVVQLADGEFFTLGREVVWIVRGHLQEALKAGARVLRALSLHKIMLNFDYFQFKM
jgi:hypothetical protein